MMKKILVPVDGSEHASKAIEFAADMARQNNATVHLLHVVKKTKPPKGLEHYITTERIKEPQESFYLKFIGNPIIRTSENEARDKGIKHIETSLIMGDPAEEIISYAKDHYIDMIVIGSRSLGSVSTMVCRASDRTCVIVKKRLLDGKRILIADDEPDVLESLAELLTMCEVMKTSSFEEAKVLLENQYFDMAILDIMGVNGYKLLEIANERKVIAVMLSAHALSPENTERAFKEGAASYVPKEKMVHITTYLNDILEAKEKGKHFWWRWFERFGSYYEKKFGADLRNKSKKSIE